MECLTSLVGIKELCSADTLQPLFFLDDAEGVDRLALSEISKRSSPSGKHFGLDLIESASRFLITDLETLIPKGYEIKKSLNSFCNTCTYTSLTSNLPFTGVIITNLSTSPNTYLGLDSLKVMIQSTGSFSIVIDDGVDPKMITQDFVAGEELIITNIGYRTIKKSIKLYFLEDGIVLQALDCPTTKGCGCSGGNKQNKDVSVTGLMDGSSFSTQYGFIPCATIICSMDNIICQVINQQPRLFALALFYRSTAKYFAEFPVTVRNNRNASFDQEEKINLANQYMQLYYERLRGSSKVKGIADNMAAALNSLNDACVDCRRMTTNSWAAG